MTLFVFNTLSREKEKFVPLTPGFVGIYVCGPTVYGHSHLGHAKSYLSFDIIVRYLRYLGHRVRYVQNITDVGHLTDDTAEDKIAKQSRLERLEPMEIVEKYTHSYFEDMDALGLLRPDISPRASAHIPEQIRLIESLFEKGAAYESKGNVYFSIESFAPYGKLSGRKQEDQEAGARVTIDEGKRNPADFLLWRKASEEHILQWDSPWGPGYPGWHLECSAMAMRYLGKTIDIHGGGLENQFPHHESEIAQSETVTGKQFARYWIHNNMVTVNGQKMGKSLGNFVTLKDVFERHHPSLIRFFLLRGHYRSQVDYSEEAIHAASSGLERIRAAYALAKEKSGTADEGDGALGRKADETKAAFLQAMDEDFNTPKALAATFELVTAVNQAADPAGNTGGNEWLRVESFFEEEFRGVLGVVLEGEVSGGGLEPELVELLLATRRDLRGEKNFALSDKIRDGLLTIGIEIKDSKEGTAWKKKST
jgi:cysteinyl-tRNA synthetase